MKIWVSNALEFLESSLRFPRHELNELDWKAALSPDKKRLAEHLSAFSNYPGGGYLVYGIGSDGIPKAIEEKAVSEAVNQLANVGRSSVEPQIALDHALSEHQGTPILIISIKESDIKPVHVRGNMQDTFIRSCGTTRKASRQEIGALMLHSKTPRWEELRASPLVLDEQLLKLLEARSIFELLQQNKLNAQDELLAWLTAEKFIIREPAGGGYVTNLGAIASAEKIADFQDLSRKAVRVVIYKGFNKSITLEETIGQKGYAVGFQGLLSFITKKLPMSEVIEKALRVRRPIYPETALREIIANALIHQDFSITGAGPLVEIYDDRIEISNPGSLLPSKTPDRLIGTQPESRNQELARAFMRYRICEERGSGLVKAGFEAELFGLPPIEFVNGPNWFKVTLHSPRTFTQMSAQERLSACYQHACLKQASRDVMTNKSLRERLKMPERQRSMVSLLIQEALDSNLIKRADPSSKSKKFAEYVPHWA